MSIQGAIHERAILMSIAEALRAAADSLSAAADAQAAMPAVPAPTEGDKLLITISEAAERLSIGRSFAYQLVQTGALPTVQLGRRRLVPVHALVILIDPQQS